MEEGGCTQTCTLKHTRVGAVGSEGDIRALGEQDVGQDAPLKTLGHTAGLRQLMG